MISYIGLHIFIFIRTDAKSWHKYRAEPQISDTCDDLNSVYFIEQTDLYLIICCFLFFQVTMSFKEAQSEELAKNVVTFDKNEGKEVLKHTGNYFKKQNVRVRRMDNIVAKYRKRNSTSCFPEGGCRKKLLTNSFKHRSIYEQQGGHDSTPPSSSIWPELNYNSSSFEKTNNGQNL